MFNKIKGIYFKNKLEKNILACEKPTNSLKIIKHNAKFLHESGCFTSNIYSVKNDNYWGFFNTYENSTNSIGKILFPRIENFPNDKWYKFKLKKQEVINE